MWLALPAMAETKTAPAPADFKDVETLLNQIEADHHRNRLDQINDLAARLNAALATDTALLNSYEEAYADANFEGAQKEQAQLKAWKDRNRANFRDGDFLWAVRAHVRYLLLSLRKKAGEDAAAMSQTLEWIQSFPKSADRFQKAAANDLIRSGAASSVFLKANSQAGILQGMSNWYLGDLSNLPEMHRVNVIGWLRSKKDPQIFSQWDTNIALEQEAAEREGLAVKRQHFVMHRRPWLLWQIGKDYDAYGQKRQAVDTMLRALKESPRCDDYDRIVAEIRRVIADAKAPGK